MYNLADKKTHEAWEKFKKYLIQLGYLKENIDHPKFEQQQRYLQQLAQMAFKQGFVEGSEKAAQRYEIMKVGEITRVKPIDPDQEQHDKKVHKTGFTRNVVTVNRRSDEQIKRENEAIIRLLREHIDAMPLHEIIKGMQQLGYTHWSDRNASGFVQYAMRHGKPIKKAGHGFYEYDWRGER